MEVRGQSFKASYVASGNLGQYRLVINSDLDVYLNATSGAVVMGVIQNKPNNDEEATLVTGGHTKVIVANSLGSGIPVMAGNSGFAVRATSGQYVAGYLVQGATSGAPAELNFSPYWLTASL